jgi:uncharacterized protein with HEPN domain
MCGCARRCSAKLSSCMRRELLLIGEMIEAAEQANVLVANADVGSLTEDRQRREALLWNFTVLGEAAAQLDDTVKERFPEVQWAQPVRLRNRIIHGYWSVDLEILHTAATDQLPAFAEQLRGVLVTLEAEGET